MCSVFFLYWAVYWLDLSGWCKTNRRHQTFTNDIFKGFPCSILLEHVGIISGRKLRSFSVQSFPFVPSPYLFLNNGHLPGSISITADSGNRFIFSILAAGTSYVIAVPAALKNICSKANPGLYLPMSGCHLSVNITVGMPLSQALFNNTSIHWWHIFEWIFLLYINLLIPRTHITSIFLGLSLKPPPL